MRGVIFDLDDTLYPRERFIRSGLAAVARYAERRFGIPRDRALTTLLTAGLHDRGREFQALSRTFGLDADVLPDLVRVFRAHVPTLWLFHDAEATLRQLRLDGWQLAVLTNGLPEVQAEKVRALQVADLVDEVVFADAHCTGGKPHPEAFAEVLRRLALPAEHCVMVGDDIERDIRGARAAGLRTIAVDRRGAGHPPDADVVVDSLVRILDVVHTLVPEVARAA